MSAVREATTGAGKVMATLVMGYKIVSFVAMAYTNTAYNSYDLYSYGKYSYVLALDEECAFWLLLSSHAFSGLRSSFSCC